jgi:hypothetical protein
MGNNNNTIKYDLDTEIINTERIVENKKICNINNYDKLFITYDEKKEIYMILIKVIDNKLYVYLKNISNNIFKLVQIVILSKYINSDTKKYINYIYISIKYDIISLPEYDMINIYSLSELINNNNLKQINNTGLYIKQYENKFLLYHENKAIHDIDTPPYKCYLCRDMIILILSLEYQYNKIIGIEYKNDRPYIIDNININIDTTKIQLSNNICVLYDYKNHLVYTTDIENDMHNITVTNKIIPNTFCLSDDGKLFFHVSNINEQHKLCFSIYNIIDNRYYDNTIDSTNMNINFKETEFNLINYDKIKDISIMNNHNIYILIGWDTINRKIYYWFIKYNTNECKVYNCTYINIDITGDIKYNYHHRFVYIFKTDTGVITYDLDNILPIKFADIMKNEILKQLDLYYKKKKCSKNRYIKIRCADDKIKRYDLNDIMIFFINKHDDIYNNAKSFNIFQKLLESNRNIDSVIIDIFNVDGDVNKYNIMNDLLDHIYEYTKKIIIDMTDGINELKAYYVGYVLIIFILKFYRYFTKKNNKYIKKGIINTFNLNYPIFADFMNNSIDNIT